MTQQIETLLSIQTICKLINRNRRTLWGWIRVNKFPESTKPNNHTLGGKESTSSGWINGLFISFKIILKLTQLLLSFATKNKSYRRLLTILLIMMIRSDNVHEDQSEVDLGCYAPQSIELLVNKGEHLHIIRDNFDSSWSAEREHTSRLVEGK
jgi:prophage regulatory protein